MGAALLKSIGLDDLIVENENSYVELAIRIAQTPALRAEISARIKAAMNNKPIFLDTLAASDQFGNLIETAYDELVEVGAKAFRRNRRPLRAQRAAPLSRDERRRHGNELLAQGNTARAVTYLLAALEQDDGTAGLWLDAAKALRANGNHNDAITALENAIRIDETLHAGWSMLAELADQAGNVELADQCRKIMADLQPDEPKAVPASDASGALFF
jgi:predicted O-linked N-acetylglucosamine transferase (SPINDLY family)